LTCRPEFQSILGWSFPDQKANSEKAIGSWSFTSKNRFWKSLQPENPTLNLVHVSVKQGLQTRKNSFCKVLKPDLGIYPVFVKLLWQKKQAFGQVFKPENQYLRGFFRSWCSRSEESALGKISWLEFQSSRRFQTKKNTDFEGFETRKLIIGRFSGSISNLKFNIFEPSQNRNKF
jgi:hypothetical protein